MSTFKIKLSLIFSSGCLLGYFVAHEVYSKDYRVVTKELEDTKVKLVKAEVDKKLTELAFSLELIEVQRGRNIASEGEARCEMELSALKRKAAMLKSTVRKGK